MDGNASFGYWVRRQRKALDLTQAELARRVGCAEGTIRMIEADARRPARLTTWQLPRLTAPPSSVLRGRSCAPTGSQHRCCSIAAAPTSWRSRPR